MFQYLLAFVCLIFIIVGCDHSPQSEKDVNPHAEGFNVEESDAEAIMIADSVMNAMGGRKAWDNTEVIKWNFFGRRTLDWDKKHNTVAINLISDSILIDLDMSKMAGKVFFKGVQQTEPDTLAKYLERGKTIWINDSYWLVMPYKLKDSGVTLKYSGTDTTAAREPAHVLSLTFDNVGVTPDNKYEVLVSQNDYLVKEWRFFTQATDTIPRFTSPWEEYRQYGQILLSGNRGRSQLSEISVRNSE